MADTTWAARWKAAAKDYRGHALLLSERCDRDDEANERFRARIAALESHLAAARAALMDSEERAALWKEDAERAQAGKVEALKNLAQVQRRERRWLKALVDLADRPWGCRRPKPILATLDAAKLMLGRATTPPEEGPR